jgi:hypothetical protein
MQRPYDVGDNRDFPLTRVTGGYHEKPFHFFRDTVWPNFAHSVEQTLLAP